MTFTPNRSGGDYLAVLGGQRPLGDLHGPDDVGAVDVDVEDADAVALSREGDGEVDGDSGLADTALAAVDADLMGNPGEGVGDRALLLELAFSSPRSWRAPGRPGG